MANMPVNPDNATHAEIVWIDVFMIILANRMMPDNANSRSDWSIVMSKTMFLSCESGANLKSQISNLSWNTAYIPNMYTKMGSKYRPAADVTYLT